MFRSFLEDLISYIIYWGNTENADKEFKENLDEEIRLSGENRDDQGNSNSEKGSGEGNEVIFVESNGPDN